MGTDGVKVGALFFLVSMLWTGGKAQSGCASVLIKMAPCLTYVTGGSSSPSSSCCSTLSGVVNSQPQCLCTALNGGASSLGININQTLALALPGACNVQTPPVSRCGAANGPEMSPESSPSDTSAQTPDSSVPRRSSVSGTKTIPTNGVTSDGGRIIEIPLLLVAVLVFKVSYASILKSF